MNIEELEKDYNSGMLKKDIITKHHITMGQLNYQINKNHWTRTKKGNKYAKGNKGGHGTIGNKNAVVTGAYSKMDGCFSDDELEVFNEPIKSKKKELEDEIKILKVREYRMLKKIKELKESKDLTIMKISKYGTTTSSEAENTQLLIIRFEQALTKVQEAKRRVMNSLHKIDIENKKFDYEKTRDKNKDKDNPQSTSDRIVIINDLPNPGEEEFEENEPSTD